MSASKGPAGVGQFVPLDGNNGRLGSLAMLGMVLNPSLCLDTVGGFGNHGDPVGGVGRHGDTYLSAPP